MWTKGTRFSILILKEETNYLMSLSQVQNLFLSILNSILIILLWFAYFWKAIVGIAFLLMIGLLNYELYTQAYILFILRWVLIHIVEETLRAKIIYLHLRVLGLHLESLMFDVFIWELESSIWRSLQSLTFSSNLQHVSTWLCVHKISYEVNGSVSI